VSPRGIVEAAAASFDITWLDPDDDPTAILRVRCATHNAAPFTDPPHVLLQGTLVGEVLARDPANLVRFDVAATPPGAYHVYVVTDDPPFCLATFADGLIVVRGAGGRAPLGAQVTRPSGLGDIFDDVATLELVAVAPVAPRVDVRAGRLGPRPPLPSPSPAPDGGTFDLDGGTAFDGPRPPCDALLTPTPAATGDDVEWQYDVARDVLMERAADAPDRWRLVVSWDTRQVIAGDYAVGATVRAEQQQVTAWAPALLTVYHPQRGAITSPRPTGAGGCAAHHPAASCAVVVALGLLARRRAVTGRRSVAG
jgi:hypothetical protein